MSTFLLKGAGYYDFRQRPADCIKFSTSVESFMLIAGRFYEEKKSSRQIFGINLQNVIIPLD